MDASSSLQENYFDAIKSTVIDTIKHLPLSDTAFRVRGALTFDHQINEISIAGKTKDEILDAIAAAELTGGLTRMYLAINKITQYLTNRM